MRAVVFHGHEDFRLDDVADPGIVAPTDLLVRVEKAAICGSDLHLWHAENPPETGFVVGHEFLGVVEDAGSEVRTVKTGDRVLVSCTTGCGHCRSCRAGLYSGCSVTTHGLTANNVFGFSNALPGGQAEAVRVPFADANCFAVPEGLADEQVLFLTDILPTAFFGAEMAGVSAGDVVVVLGCGPVGTLAQRCAQLRGAAAVIAVDPEPSRRERARAAGCIAVDPLRENLVEIVLEHTGGLGADAVIEAVGKEELVAQAAVLCRPGGTISVVGVMIEPIQVMWPLFLAKNLTLRTGLVNPQVYVERLIGLIQEGRIDPTEIITHRYPLERALDGYRAFANREEGVLKVVLDVA